MTYDFKDKNKNINQMNRYMLAKTLSMFEYEGLPRSIPVRELEKLLQTHGYAFITKAPNDKLYAFVGGLGGLPCPYGNPTEIVIANPALKFYKTLKIKTDGILIKNDDLNLGLMGLYEKYNTMLAENDINIVLDGYSTRMNTLISATDDKTKESAEAYMKKIVGGEISIIGENALFDGVKVQGNSNGAGSSISRLIELTQYLKGSLYNEVGLSSNFNMKKERLITAEIEQQEDGTFPFVYNMMKNRIKGIEQVNEMYGTEIDVDFGSVWNIKNREFVDDVVEDDLSAEHIPHGDVDPTNEIVEQTNEVEIELVDDEIVEDILTKDDEIVEDILTKDDEIVEDVLTKDDGIELEDEIIDEVEIELEDEIVEEIIEEIIDEVESELEDDINSIDEDENDDDENNKKDKDK